LRVRASLLRIRFGAWLISVGERISGIEVTGMRG
jgi:hypothetical protein